jgi:RNA polymerase sigma-70 factor, ECF subfamily
MSATLPEAENKHDSPGKTLGDLLQADQARPEREWVGLLEAIAAGDQLALRVLYGRSHRLVFTLSMRLVQNRASAEEVTVDVFHEIWRRAGTYDPSSGTVIGWIMNQARSRAIDRLRFEHRKKRAPAPDVPSPDAQPPANAAEEPLETADQGRLLQAALTILTPSEREAIDAAFFGESSYSQVATSLNQPLGTIKTRIRSGLLKLREALGPREGDL